MNKTNDLRGEVVTRRQQHIETAIIVAGAIGAFVVLWLKSEGAL
jgi:hypothetical protein